MPINALAAGDEISACRFIMVTPTRSWAMTCSHRITANKIKIVLIEGCLGMVFKIAGLSPLMLFNLANLCCEFSLHSISVRYIRPMLRNILQPYAADGNFKTESLIRTDGFPWSDHVCRNHHQSTCYCKGNLWGQGCRTNGVSIRTILVTSDLHE
jgi:hypothetical protein